MPTKTRIIVAENHTISRKGYISLLKDLDNITVVGEAANGKELIDQMATTEADMVLLDIEMPVMGGKEALKIIKEKYPAVQVIILSFHKEESLMVEFIKMGANAFVPKESSYETFVESIQLVREEGLYYNKNISKALVSELMRNNWGFTPGLLTERESEIVILICEGKTNKQIAEKLNVVVKTIDFHKGNIYKKTKTCSTAGLYNFAIKAKLISEKEQ